ncbi:hypothetical protein SASPL_104684 [Salvia splendens]|uniref:Uncharacterized protein n=1 Tax=Salvia splendens TaxID=180675 RepID=A0A8X9A8M5_SALSN|nr:hypothetical protein SASPL_104684 [Salvia splendens]
MNHEEAEVDPFIESSCSTQISSSSSIPHENVAFSVGQIGMIFGNLSFEPTLSTPLMVKLEAATVDGDSATQLQHHFYCGKPSSSATTTLATIQIKQEDEIEEVEDVVMWDRNNVKRKKRSKLPQYTLSPLARFMNQLQYASCCRRRGPHRLTPKPKYDDVLIYERCCLYVPENEIGLGVELLLPPLCLYDSSFVGIKEESSSTSQTSV